VSRRRWLLVALAILALALWLAPEAWGAAGGGSGGFGGGGGGGGGRGAGLYILIQILIRVAIFGHGIGALVLIGLIVLALLFTRMAPSAQRFWTARQDLGHAARRDAARRQRRVELAAAEAAEDDPAFAPEAVRAAGTQLFKSVQTAWAAADRSALKRLVAPSLLEEWERRLDGLDRRGWHNHVELIDAPRVEYVNLSRTAGTPGQVVVRIEARLRDFVQDASGRRIKRAGHLSETVMVREYWTLRRQPGGWLLESIEQGGEGEHALSEQIVGTPWSDEQALRDEALLEGAEAVPAGTSLAEVADLRFTGDARAAALDLSLVDGRFSPDVLEVAARRAAKAWAQAVDGDDDALLELASPTAARELLHPGDPSARTRLVVRGPQIKTIRITGLDAGAEPPTMTLEVDVEGRRYLEDRDTTDVLAGSRSRTVRFTERWRFALSDDRSKPWRIAAASPALART
jgi:predicted lipid-binding transport protein (Tim44 family)